MRFTRRLLPRNAVSYALFALAPLASYAQDASAPEPHGIAVADMDRSVKPGDDFYYYANGDWIKRTEIPPDRRYIDPNGLDFDNSNDLTRKRIASLIEEAARTNAPAGSNACKIADFYHSYMDEAAIEAKGIAPLRPKLDAIAVIRDKHELARALGESLRADVDAVNIDNFHTANLFGLFVGPAFNDPEHYTAYLLQGGLEMPDREYYLSDSDSMRDIRTKYQAHVSALFKLAGFSEPELRAQHIIKLEHAIAEKHIPLADSHDIFKANNTWKQADFAANAPGLDWAEYFRGAGLSGQTSFIVWQPTAFTGESALVASTALDTWKEWLAFHLIEDYADVLPKAFADERFAFFGKALSGKTEQRPRWQGGVAMVSSVMDETGNRMLAGRGVLGDAVGQMYAQRYFSPDTKARIQAMVANIIAAYRRRIDALSWMDPATKAEAQAKLSNLYVGIGYPETWRDYSSYEVKANDIFGNLWRGGLFDYHRAVARLGDPVDRRDWCELPQQINACELPLQNAINFPAANFQPPYFDPQASAAVNYGAIGAFIGHEISHAFDTEGSAFDSTGRVRNWWKSADLEHFNAATGRLAAQYDTYKPFPDLAVNGKQTINENIADLAGISAAYDAYRASLAGKAAPVENGFTGDQQFFLGFAQMWASKSSEAFLREQLITDDHSPDQFRPVTVRNLDAWYAAFDVKPGDKLYLAPADRVRIW
ncbi:MAG TPA: M13 family metallopeptidase [Terriglobia bacterium]|nr:M13 family metallopeptidase [Terriglobia bacterium]